jgi:hypothetical protein
MAEQERVLELSAKKDRIIPAEESLLLDWSPILEKEVKGCILLYLQLQRAAYDSGEGKKARIGMKRLSDLCANTAPTLNKCLSVLEKYEFISIERGKKSGVSNVYIINPLPKIENFAEEVKFKISKGMKESLIEGEIRVCLIRSLKSLKIQKFLRIKRFQNS